MVVESFLKSELNSLHVDKYLNLFENYIQIHHGIKNKKDGLEVKDWYRKLVIYHFERRKHHSIDKFSFV